MPTKKKQLSFVDRRNEITTLTDDFCQTHLNQEYLEMCRKMAQEFCVSDSPALEGKAKNWAAAIVSAVGWVNFLGDPSQNPHMTQKELAQAWGISPATLAKYVSIVRRGFDLMQFDPDFTLPSRMQNNPLIWMVTTPSGLPIDVRILPRHVQEKLVERGVIPFLPEPLPESACCGGGCCSPESVSDESCAEAPSTKKTNPVIPKQRTR